MGDELAMALVELKRDEVLETVKEKAERGDDPLGLLEECRRGMTIVGDRFQAGEFYLAEMMLATLKGDIHDLGKDIVATLLRGKCKLMVGGGVTTPTVKEHIGADFQTLDAMEGVSYCLKEIARQTS